MGHLLCSLLLIFSSPISDEEKECPECRANRKMVAHELQEIDFALKQLSDLRLLYRARALWHFDLATRLQFKSGRFLEARKAFAEADYEWQQVALIEKKIAYLQKRREALLKEYE